MRREILGFGASPAYSRGYRPDRGGPLAQRRPCLGPGPPFPFLGYASSLWGRLKGSEADPRLAPCALVVNIFYWALEVSPAKLEGGDLRCVTTTDARIATWSARRARSWRAG